MADIHDQGHDAIVEPYLGGYDVQVAFITVDRPVMLPMLIYEREDTQRLWTYYEKRDLIQNNEKSSLKRFEDPEWAPIIAEHAARVAREFEPFDYGRIEFRLDRDDGRGQFHRDQPQLQSVVGKGDGQGGRGAPASAMPSCSRRSSAKACAGRGCSPVPAEPRFTIVILAAQRDGALDPLAAEAGVTPQMPGADRRQAAARPRARRA